MKNLNNWKFIVIALIAGLFLGWVFFGGPGSQEREFSESHIHDPGTEFTCSMHPQIRQSESGQCPICGMDLVPITDIAGGAGDPMSLEMTEAAMKLASIQTTIVSKERSVGEIKLSGKVAVDERNVFNQSAHFPGRIEKLRIKFEGESVRKGQKIASIYSPKLITAQEELLEAYKSRENNEILWNASRNKIKLWKLPESFIDEVVSSGEIRTEIDIIAEHSGIVTSLNVSEGDHLMEGGLLFQVVNLSNLWVLFDAYESDLALVHINDQVHFSVPSLPGEHFHGKVTYIDPVINPATRTVSIRAEIQNTNGQLKPEMFVDGIIVVNGSSDEEILIPRSSVLWTGSRSIVYVKEANTAIPSFQMREIELGSRSGDSYVVKSGLSDGEEVVINGVFSVDAASQLQGKPSMMNTSGEKASTGHQHGEAMHMSSESMVSVSNKDQEKQIPAEFKEQLKEAYLSYLKVKDALIQTNGEETARAAEGVLKSLAEVKMNLVKSEDHMKWMEYHGIMEEASKNIEGTENVEDQRAAFSTLTSGLVSAVKYFGLEGEKVYYQYCPMAFNNKGDFWLSDNEEVLNPYFGDKMLRCGEVVEVIEF
jgi:Cu(I)/Ag(I) efflux system membrane fusion protein